MLRLRVQLEPQADAAGGNPNWMSLAALGRIDLRILRESLKVASTLQQRLRLDYER